MKNAAQRTFNGRDYRAPSIRRLSTSNSKNIVDDAFNALSTTSVCGRSCVENIHS
uniref:Uncharacterized protein n=1 Tax=Hyaloperonospora arabidopsidis (strain Emoy2) TaxID=559515 RepID=M4C2V5_HYAAE